MKPMWWHDRVSSDTRLSTSARWLLCWLGHRPAGWRYSVEEAQTAAGVGRQKYQSMMAELKAVGYVEATYKRDRRGRLVYTKLTLRDTAPKGGKSCLRSERTEGREIMPSESDHRRAGFKAFGPRHENPPSGIYTHARASSGSTVEPELGHVAPLRIIGGRDA